MFNWRRNSLKTISLAIPGGGSHGAYIWGVLDRLLEDERLGIEGISGTSSGAINGALVAYGLMEDGRAGARRRLETFWWRISEACRRRRRSWLSLYWRLRQGRVTFSSAGVLHELMSRWLMPYDFNPANMNPLRHVIGETIDFSRLRECKDIKLFVNATNIMTNRAKLFSIEEISLDAICASACLPFLFQPVEIDGQYYWDGGYMGNPAIYPLLEACENSDIVLVQTNPMKIPHPPRTAGEILERVTEISFTSTFMREMSYVALVSELMAEGRVKRRAGLREIRVHMIEPQGHIQGLMESSRFNADWTYLLRLFERGREVGDQWLAQNFDQIGERSTVDLREVFT